MLGLSELEKHAPLADRGGACFALPDGRQLHHGVEEPFRASRKAHPAFAAADLDKLAGMMRGPFREQARVSGAVAVWTGI